MDWRVLEERTVVLLRDPAWIALRGRPGISSWAMIDADTGVPVVRAETALAAEPEALAQYLVRDLVETLPQWNPMAAGGELLEDLGDGERVLRLVNRLPWPMRRREDVFYNACKRLDDGTWIELSTSVEHPGAPSRRELIRSAMHLATKRMATRRGGGCDYAALWHYDLRGWLGRAMPRRSLARAIANDLVGELERLRARFGAA